ncbi:MAG: CPBP family intramembrane metalloprotease [Candidatus Scalindua sp. AMX11]|nr:MAG: CPBP family intramembrane metalloprotease [Candidatus Scalindua sp.]NOG85141.1 CPBP family intramembrane metalloprotease [Planctomycetota bacterium]RZV67653.1 MAG: CPBP family intramembrane metalloprotease [Candidatus Scalindua sp. SCAELEC01]TDE63705.1 MAG: CPBP family intramembrane metalloprotease [Candidatus Scalindua sp. AMX11]GJQ57214.1 MAG: hypothetical protein SCALA701_00150 [Candidatus Scalindua sp.]
MIAYPRKRLLILAFVSEGMLLLLALLFSRLFGIRLFPLTVDVVKDVALGTIGTLFPLAIFAFFLTTKSENLPLFGSLRKIVINDIKVLFTNASLLDIVTISALAGIAEELLFRGIVQPKVGIVWASVIFGLLHCLSPAYFVIATVMGLYLGFLCDYYQSLLIPIHLHFLYDLGVLICLKYYVKGNFVKSS